MVDPSVIARIAICGLVGIKPKSASLSYGASSPHKQDPVGPMYGYAVSWNVHTKSCIRTRLNCTPLGVMVMQMRRYEYELNGRGRDASTSHDVREDHSDAI